MVPHRVGSPPRVRQVVCGVLFVLLAANAIIAVASPDTERASLLELRRVSERPDDSPGLPARVAPWPQPSGPVQFGPFTHVQVNAAYGGVDIVGDAANEPSIAVDPTNPNRIAIGWRQFDTTASNFRQAGYAWTGNGGAHWLVGVLEPGVFRSDPVLVSDSAGNFYYNSLRVVNNQWGCWVFKSNAGGIGWGPAVFAYGGDKAWMAVDRSGGLSDGYLYTVCSIHGNNYTPRQFNRSTDAAVSFEPPVIITFSPIWGTLDVAPNGDVYVGGIDPGDPSIFYVARSSNAQNPAVTPSWDYVVQVDLGGSLIFGSAPSPNPGGLLGQVALAVDQTTSGPTAGNIYLLASVDPPGADPLDVRFARGINNGLSWTLSKRINDDATDNGAWQWFGTMSVAPGGRVDVLWNDTRNTGVANHSQLFHASSSDGGGTWTANQQLSPSFDSYVGWPNQNKIGDYYDMVSDDVGVHVAWAATFNGGQDVYYLRIGDYDCNTNGVADSIDIAMGTSLDEDLNGKPDECDALTTAARQRAPEGYSLYQNVPNPFNPTTVIAFELPAGGGRVVLRIYDTTGRLVRTLFDGFESAGRKSVVWDGRDDAGRGLATGVYFYRLEAPGFTASRKLVLIK